MTLNGCRVRAEDLATLRALFTEFAAAVRSAEPGCLFLRLLEDAADPCAAIIYAEFTDQAAYDAHLRSAHVASLRERLHPLIGDTHHKTIYRPLGADAG